MIDKVFSALNNSTLLNIAENTKAAISIETGLKAAGRPAFIMADKNVDKKTQKYAAAKEFLYQALCLGLYLALIIPLFKKGTFGIFKKIFKDEESLKLFNNASECLAYHKLVKIPERAKRIEHKEFKNLNKMLQKMKDPDKKQKLQKIINILDCKTIESCHENSSVLGKGVIEFSSIIGSILGLTIIAPQISHYTLHPVMNFLGLKKDNNKPEEHDTTNKQKQLNKLA